jgi:DUF1365 family protein
MVTMSSAALYRVEIKHVRTQPVEHAFSYGGYQWLVDLADLPRLPRGLRVLAGFRSEDHLGDPSLTIKQNVERFLALHGVELNGGRIRMLSQARVLGYVFNPLSVYWCYGPDDELRCVIAEVHNTYGDRHAYLIETDERGRASVDKAFYVSPFNPVDGRYQMHLPYPHESLDLTITLHRPDTAPFVASMRGVRTSASATGVLRTFLRHPVAPLVGAARIRRHGVALWLRGLRPVPRPAHSQEGVQ